MLAAPPAMRLATAIAAQFRHQTPSEAAATIAGHIGKYWDPRMRAQLIDQVNQAGEECDAHVAAAAGLLGKTSSE
jgi:formate dehydrogenase subunit delta